MPYKVLVKLDAPGQRFRPGDEFSDTRYGAALVSAWVRDHWVEKIEEEVEESEEEEVAPGSLFCLICERPYKTIKGFFAHVKAKHPEEL